jgi:hypothetical protein
LCGSSAAAPLRADPARLRIARRSTSSPRACATRGHFAGVDTFAFPNESRSKNWGKPDLFANYCFVMVRAVTQFHRFARFDPAATKLSSDEYEGRVAQVVSRSPWADPLPADDRVVIPGYASLYELSRAEEKAGAGLARPLSWLHWTNWRVVFLMPAPSRSGWRGHTGRARRWRPVPS